MGKGVTLISSLHVPNGILYRVYIDKELNPFYEQVSPEMHIFRTAFGDQYEYILSQYGLPEALF